MLIAGQFTCHCELRPQVESLDKVGPFGMAAL